ncbi:MAG TPA: response regulator, partial [Candidatus Angelobacter sp.]|nr:response regulator [Candidatus Angelobacter sp.]
MSDRIRVLVVDDSALMRKLIPQILARDPDIEVVGTAMDGSFGLKKIEDLKPDVVTLDLEMPRMDGMETLRQITRKYRVPVIIVSALTTEGASATFKALALGALDFVAKPRDAASAHMDEIAADLIAKIKVASKTRLKNAMAHAVVE